LPSRYNQQIQIKELLNVDFVGKMAIISELAHKKQDKVSFIDFNATTTQTDLHESLFLLKQPVFFAQEL
jgi:hypothetical protein